MEIPVPPLVSIIMPVFNTGAYLLEAICSVLHQQNSADCPVPAFELLIIDDHSTDPTTLAILAAAAIGDGRIRLLKNQRTKGAAGARNTGILHARAAWIGFLDSDDIWSPTSLSLRWRETVLNSEAKWVAARFTLLKSSPGPDGKERFEDARPWSATVATPHPIVAAKRLIRPVEQFSNACFIGVMTILIARSTILSKGLFNEALPRAEDYHLWFKCATDTDLWLIDADVGMYRIHSKSLTHGNAPKYLFEDIMIKLLSKDPSFRSFKDILKKRLDFVMQDFCYFHRSAKQFDAAVRSALQWITKRPLNASAWKELLAAGLQIA